jgi:hypothetical protein
MTIGDSAFSVCSGLTQLVIPSSVTTIEGRAFLGCSRLQRLEIPSSVTTIEEWAFSRCSCLRQLRFPSSLTYLGGKSVFDGVKKLEHLTLIGSVLSPAVVVALEGCLTSTAKVIGPALIERESGCLMFGGGRRDRVGTGGGRFGRFAIVAA